MRRRSNSKRACERRRIAKKLDRWEASELCVLSGLYCPFPHTHHLLTVGAHPALYLCPWNRLNVLPDLHRLAHDDENSFNAMVEKKFPGLLDSLILLEREWSKMALFEREEAIDSVISRQTHREFWESLEAA